MKTNLRITLTLALGLFTANAAMADDAVIGALLGGGAGAVVGRSVGGRDGTIIGGALGAAAGAAIGANRGHARVDYYAPAPVYYTQPAYRPQPVVYYTQPVRFEQRPVYYVQDGYYRDARRRHHHHDRHDRGRGWNDRY